MHVGEHRKNSACRACKGTRLTKFLDLGLFPAVNNMLTKEALAQSEPHYPLEVYFCQDCALVQLVHIVPPEILFSHYVYLTATSSTMVAHLKEMTKDVHERFLSRGGLAVDIGSNDGTLLKGYPKGVELLGIEPAQNVAKMANEGGVRTVAEFFNESTAKTAAKKFGKADVITATNVFAHIDDWDSVIRGVDAMLKDDGIFVIEAPYLVDFIKGNEFDTVYH
ncbi:MAG: methyltransferase domain-containing protein, partial [Candidatus Aenigmarchaeota archaeon]|nr:methyltransferase domain-containing protein [Candidatus Aenigmarchaeota archaeon]